MTVGITSFALFEDFNFPEFDWETFCPNLKNSEMFKKIWLNISAIEKLIKLHNRKKTIFLI